MKLTKTMFAMAGALALSMGAAQAQWGNGDDCYYDGWFDGGGPVAHQVSEVQQSGNPYQLVELDGNLVKDGGGYVFRDKTGQIVANVPYECVMGLPITNETPVKIQGNVRQDIVAPASVDVYTVDCM